jgi:O-antigen/teichoic acid export membrane protein
MKAASAAGIVPGGARSEMNHQPFFKHALVYGISNFLVQASGFVLLPLYTRCLSKADYGALEVLGRVAEIVSTCLLVGGIRQAMVTYYQQSEGVDRQRVIGTALGLIGCTCLLGGGLVLLFAAPLSTCFRTQSPGLLRLAVLVILLEPFNLLPLALVQARVESLSFVWTTLTQFVTRVTLSILLVGVLGWGIAGVLAATAFTLGIYGIFLSGREVIRHAAWPEAAKARGLLGFALPFLPGGVCFLMMQHGDRFFILGWHGEEEVATYSLGYKLALVVATFSVGPLFMVWSARMYEAARAADASVVFGRVFTRILSAFVFVGLGLCLFQEEAVLVLGGRNYTAAGPIVSVVVLAALFQNASSLMDAGFYVRRRTGPKVWITLSATVVMLVLYFALIPPFAGLGAALATLGGFAFLAGCTWWVTQRVFPVQYEWPRLIAMVTLALVLWLFSRFLPATLWTAPIKGVLLLAWPVLLWHGKAVSADEKEHVRLLLRQTVAKVRERLGRVRPEPIIGVPMDANV